MKAPSFNFPGVTPGAFCGTHKRDGMIDVKHKRAAEPAAALLGARGGRLPGAPASRHCLQRAPCLSQRPLVPLRVLRVESLGGRGAQARRSPPLSTLPWRRPWRPSQRWGTRIRRACKSAHACKACPAGVGKQALL